MDLRRAPSSQSSNISNKRRRRQAVHWAEDGKGVSLTNVILLNDPPASTMSDNEKSLRWYQYHEIRELNRGNADLVKGFHSSIYCDQTMASVEDEALQYDFSFRGFERYEVAGIRYRTSFATKSRKRVLEEQDMLQQHRLESSCGFLDSGTDHISKVYSEDTKLHRDLARMRALQDEEFVVRISLWNSQLEEAPTGTQISIDNAEQKVQGGSSFLHPHIASFLKLKH